MQFPDERGIGAVKPLLFHQAKLAKCPEHRWPVAVGDSFAIGVSDLLDHAPSHMSSADVCLLGHEPSQNGSQETHRPYGRVFPRSKVYNIVPLLLRRFGAVRRGFGVGEASLWRSCRTFLAGKA